MKARYNASTAPAAALHTHAGTSSLASRWSTSWSATNSRVKRSRAGTSRAGIAVSRGMLTGSATNSVPSWIRSEAFQSPWTGTGSELRHVPAPVGSSSLTTRPPPCHEVTLAHAASSPSPGGEIRAFTRTSRRGSGCVSLRWTVAWALPGSLFASPPAVSAPSATIEAAKAPRATLGRGSVPRSPAPNSPPSIPPASPAIAA
jgi:hypothetical protein